MAQERNGGSGGGSGLGEVFDPRVSNYQGSVIKDNGPHFIQILQAGFDYTRRTATEVIVHLSLMPSGECRADYMFRHGNMITDTVTLVNVQDFANQVARESDPDADEVVFDISHTAQNNLQTLALKVFTQEILPSFQKHQTPLPSYTRLSYDAQTDDFRVNFGYSFPNENGEVTSAEEHVMNWLSFYNNPLERNFSRSPVPTPWG